ncbi:hypothetical protein D3C72_1674800 [compost metagenome]
MSSQEMWFATIIAPRGAAWPGARPCTSTSTPHSFSSLRDQLRISRSRIATLAHGNTVAQISMPRSISRISRVLRNQIIAGALR